jgi:hypothetical protein
VTPVGVPPDGRRGLDRPGAPDHDVGGGGAVVVDERAQHHCGEAAGVDLPKKMASIG